MSIVIVIGENPEPEHTQSVLGTVVLLVRRMYTIHKPLQSIPNLKEWYYDEDIKD